MFEYINAKVVAAQAQAQPVISVDTKKKELVGNFKMAARTIAQRAPRGASTCTTASTRCCDSAPGVKVELR